jgi:hypothetical protein
MNKDDDLENGIRVEMDYFKLVVIKESAEEITGWEAESTLKGGKHHNFIRIGFTKIFTSGRAPLQHGVLREKVVRDEFADLTFICDGWLKQMLVWGGHGWEEALLRRGINMSEETEITRKKRNGGDVRNG